jgi:hypothetical protein
MSWKAWSPTFGVDAGHPIVSHKLMLNEAIDELVRRMLTKKPVASGIVSLRVRDSTTDKIHEVFVDIAYKITIEKIM